MKSNKPIGVINHRHFFPYGQDPSVETGRVDACQLADGKWVVWDLDNDEIVAERIQTGRAAYLIAEIQANAPDK